MKRLLGTVKGREREKSNVPRVAKLAVFSEVLRGAHNNAVRLKGKTSWLARHPLLKYWNK